MRDSRPGVSQDTVVEEPISTYPLEIADLMPKMMAKWFWDTYDGLLRWAIMNIGVFFFGSVWAFVVYMALAPISQTTADTPMLIRFAFFAIFAILIAVPINTLALSWMMPFARGFTHYTEPEFRWLPRQLPHLKRFAALSLAQVLINFFLIFNILFYSGQNWQPEALHWSGYILAGLFFWILLGANALMLYMAPMIADNQWTWREMIRRAVFIVLVHKWFTLGLMMMASVIWLVGIQIRLMGLAIFCHALSITLINATYQTIVDYHRAKETLQELKGNPEGVQPRTWKEKKALEEKGVLALLGGKVQPTRYQRTLKDIIKPWE